jgi:hypothetical protein
MNDAAPILTSAVHPGPADPAQAAPLPPAFALRPGCFRTVRFWSDFRMPADPVHPVALATLVEGNRTLGKCILVAFLSGFQPRCLAELYRREPMTNRAPSGYATPHSQLPTPRFNTVAPGGDFGARQLPPLPATKEWEEDRGEGQSKTNAPSPQPSSNRAKRLECGRVHRRCPPARSGSPRRVSSVVPDGTFHLNQSVGTFHPLANIDPRISTWVAAPTALRLRVETSGGPPAPPIPLRSLRPLAANSFRVIRVFRGSLRAPRSPLRACGSALICVICG